MPSPPEHDNPRSPAEVLAHYRRLRRSAAPARPRRESALEELDGGIAAGDIAEAEKALRAELHRIVRTYLCDKPELHEIADKLASDGSAGLAAFASGDEETLAQPGVLAGFETIVRTDGTRPSFMIRGGVPDLASSPAGDWAGAIEADNPDFRAALACVGRIDDPSHSQGFRGTGTLIAPNLVLTNRHVLQSIAEQAADGTWALKPDIAIDFGHEHQGTASLNPRKVKGVVFAGAQWINPNVIDHGKLDAALIELEPVAAGLPEPRCLPLDCTGALDAPDKRLFLVGYPGDPGYAYTPPTLLEQLFQSTFGCKRLAPGLVMGSASEMHDNPRHWTLPHDATTLGGNSGSAILIIGRYGTTAGLHYGGRWSAPRENWCHILKPAMNEIDGHATTFKEILSKWGVDMRESN